MKPFAFLDPGELTDGEIALTLQVRSEADPERGWVPWYGFAIREAASGEPVGQIALRIGGEKELHYAGHIGYAVDEPHRGHRYAMKACRLLFPLARRHGIERLLITCNPDNAASRRTCELLGGRLLEIADLPEDDDMYREGERQKCIFLFQL